MMSTRTRRGVAVAGGLAAILAMAWFRSADRTKVPVAPPVANRPAAGEPRTPSLTLGPETPTHFTYDLSAWRSLLPVPVVPVVRAPVTDSEGVAVAPERAADEAEERTLMDPWVRGSDVASAWAQLDRSRGYRGPWNHFLENWVDRLVVESDGVSFYDPTEYPVKSVLPVKLPKSYGFGIKFRASF